MALPASALRRPGAYRVITESHGEPAFFQLVVPPNTSPGSTIDFTTGTRRLTARCPPNAGPGHTLQIAVLPEPTTLFHPLKMAKLTTLDGTASGGATPLRTTDSHHNEEAMEASSDSFLVTVPDGVWVGMQFVAMTPQGRRFLVTCPEGAVAKQTIRILVNNYDTNPSSADGDAMKDNNDDDDPVMAGVERTSVAISSTSSTMVASTSSSGYGQQQFKYFQVIAPDDVRPNQVLPVNVCGKRIPIQLPSSVVPGQTIKLKLSVQEVIDSIELAYEDTLPGWNRTIRMSDLKFQWVKSSSSSSNRNIPSTSRSPSLLASKDVAFVRDLVFTEGNDPRLRTGTVQLIPAQDAVTESELVVGNYKTLVSYANVAHIQKQPLEVKTEWFHSVCRELSAPWESGRMQLVVRRDHLLADSVKGIMSLSRTELRKRWRIEFLNEPALDAGGITREFFQLVTEQIFDPDLGLWLSSVNNQICMRINPACHVSCPDDHLVYFRFLGRIIGRALFDGQLIQGHMVRPLYKHLLGWPITFDDLESQDEEYYNSLKQFTQMNDDELSSLYLDFTVTEEILGERKTVELVQQGSQKEVNADNLHHYLELILKYRMLEISKPQIQELLLGFFDVVPEPALAVFDPNELELILCGLPTIDMDDWRANTLLTGTLKLRPDAKVVEWFWEIVGEEFDQEMKARLLQFVTGTSGVPARGFSVLQGNDGNVKLFTINGVDRDQCPYPRSHTCFNRIDLPNYKTKAELYEKLKLAVSIAAVGFDME